MECIYNTVSMADVAGARSGRPLLLPRNYEKAPVDENLIYAFEKNAAAVARVGVGRCDDIG